MRSLTKSIFSWLPSPYNFQNPLLTSLLSWLVVLSCKRVWYTMYSSHSRSQAIDFYDCCFPKSFSCFSSHYHSSLMVFYLIFYDISLPWHLPLIHLLNHNLQNFKDWNGEVVQEESKFLKGDIGFKHKLNIYVWKKY